MAGTEITLALFPLAIRGSVAGATITMRRMQACSTSITAVAMVTATIRSVLFSPQLRKTDACRGRVCSKYNEFGTSNMINKINMSLCHSHSFLRVTRPKKIMSRV